MEQKELSASWQEGLSNFSLLEMCQAGGSVGCASATGLDFLYPYREQRGSWDEALDKQGNNLERRWSHHGGFQIHKGFSAEGKMRGTGLENRPQRS